MTVAISPRTDYHQIAAHGWWACEQAKARHDEAMDQFSREMRELTERFTDEWNALCDELGAPRRWAVLPDDDREATLRNLVRNNRPGVSVLDETRTGWTPDAQAFLNRGPAPDGQLTGKPSDEGRKESWTRRCANRP